MQNSPKSAMLHGDKFYSSGKPCIRGHFCERYTSTHACVLCLKQAKRAYRSNPDNVTKERLQQRMSRADNRDVLAERRKATYPRNRERLIRNSKAWKEKNSARVRLYGADYKRNRPAENAARAAKYNAAKMRATPSWADFAAIAAVYAEANALTLATGIPHEVDHIYPLRHQDFCGLHVHHNLVAVPESVNRKKYNKSPHDIAGYSVLVEQELLAESQP